MHTSRICNKAVFLGALVGLMVGAWTPAYCGNEAYVPAATSLAAGERVEIAITGSIEAGGLVRATMSFTPAVARILSARGSEGFAFSCPTLTVSQNRVESAQRAIFSVECPYCLSINNDTLFTLVLEGLGGMDTSGTIRVEKLEINGAEVMGAQFNVGTIERTGGAIARPQTTEGVTGTYPNPFVSRTHIVFTLSQPGIVKFTFRNAQGRLVKQLDQIQGVAGENTIDFDIEAWKVASGAYVLEMTTDRGTYFHPMTVMK